MFTVKATYRGETRKLSFSPDIFPSFEQLYSQVSDDLLTKKYVLKSGSFTASSLSIILFIFPSYFFLPMQCRVVGFLLEGKSIPGKTTTRASEPIKIEGGHRAF